MNSSRRPQAVLWDLDGTIIDSEEYWIVAETEIVERFGGTWTHEDGLAMIGNGLSDTAVYMQRHGVDLPVGDIVQTLSDRVVEQINVAVPWRPGAPEMLRSLSDAGVPMAIATMALTEMAQRITESLADVAFGAIVGGDQVAHPKPHPEVYLAAAQRLGVAPENCVAIEDSPLGLYAAYAAGCVTIGVPLLLELPDEPKSVEWPTLAGRHAHDIFDVFAQTRGAA